MSTAARVLRPAPGPVRIMTVGCAGLAARPLLIDLAGGRPALVLTALFLALLGVSLLWPVRADTSTPTSAAAEGPPAGAVLAIGIGAFVVGRILLAGSPPASATVLAVGLNTLAAVAEEAFFRRLVYGALLASGPVAALVGSAVLFAAVHVTVYGLWVLPLDLAAGLVFGWQRQATGSWGVPAVTHVVANVLVVL